MQRIIPRHSRTASYAALRVSRPPLRQYPSLLQSRVVVQPVQRFAARWYSETKDAKEAPAEGENAATEGEKTAKPTQDAPPADPTKAELDVAKKEILELKVRLYPEREKK